MPELTYELEWVLRAIATLRVNVKSLQAESKFIRHETSRTRRQEVANALSWHRKDIVRGESRIAHLALAAVRGKPYSEIEKKAKVEPDWNRILTKVKKHQRYRGADHTAKWFAEAKAYWNRRKA